MRFSRLGRSIVRLLSAALFLLAGGLAAGGVMLLLLIAVDILALVAAPNAFQGGSLVGLVAFPFWLVGAFVVGPPLWTALHTARLRDRRTALVAGGLTGVIAVPAVLWIMSGGGAPGLSQDSLLGLIVLSAIGGISGGVAGETIHYLAYRSGETEHAR